MTTPTVTTTTRDDEQPAVPYQLEWLDPRTLSVDPANKRRDLGDLAQLTASICALGVIEPLIVRPDPDTGILRILAGQRRHAAAIAANQPRVPAVVRSDLAGLPVGTAVAVVENEHRADLTAAERARAYQQLRIDGFSVAKIVKVTGTKRASVNQALTVGGSDLAVTAAERYQLSMDQALALAEFADDREAVKVLVTTAKTDPARLDHVLGRLRADRDAKAAYQASLDRLTQAGIRVISEDDPPDGTVRLSRLADPDGQPLDAEAHTSCPGHAESIVAWDPERTVAYCTDPAAAGHTDRTPFHSSHHASPSAQRGADGKLTEEAKAERRKVIEGNKAWRAARSVRRSYLQELLARRSPPKGTLRYVTTTILDAPRRVGDGPGELIAELLGVPDADLNHIGARHIGTATAEAATEARLPLILLAQVAADTEQALDDYAWRQPRPTQAARWLAWLASVGYQLSDIETQVVDAGTATAHGDDSAPGPHENNQTSDDDTTDDDTTDDDTTDDDTTDDDTTDDDTTDDDTTDDDTTDDDTTDDDTDDVA